jgi:hypothetical protein
VIPDILLALRLKKGLPMAVFHKVELTTNDGFDTTFIGFGNELEGSEHVAMVGKGHPFLTVGLSLVHHFANVIRTVKEGELGVAMEMAKFRHGVMVE